MRLIFVVIGAINLEGQTTLNSGSEGRESMQILIVLTGKGQKTVFKV